MDKNYNTAASLRQTRLTKRVLALLLALLIPLSSFVTMALFTEKTTYAATKSTQSGGLNVNTQNARNKKVAKLAAPDVAHTVKNTKTILSWKTIENADEYRIYRKHGLNGEWKQIGTTAKAFYTDVYHNTVKDQESLRLFKDNEHYYIDPTKNPFIYAVQAVQHNAQTGVVTGLSEYKDTGVFSLKTPTVLSVDVKSGQNNIVWKTVANAQYYDIYVGRIVNNQYRWTKKATVQTSTSAEALSYSVPVTAGYPFVSVVAQTTIGGKTMRSGMDKHMRTDKRNQTNRKILVVGDSLAYGEPYTKTVIGYRATYPARVSQLTGAYTYNCAVGGATIAQTKISGIYCITNDQVKRIANGNTPKVPSSYNLPTMKYRLEDYDTVLVEGGANDWGRSVKIGNASDKDVATFAGAYRVLMQTINSASKKRIAAGKKPIKVVMTGMFYSGKNNKDPVHPNSKYTRKNNVGLTYTDYENAIRAEYNAWKNMPNLRVYLFDPCNYTFLTEKNCSTATVDDLHMTAACYAEIGYNLSNFLRTEVWK